MKTLRLKPALALALSSLVLLGACGKTDPSDTGSTGSGSTSSGGAMPPASAPGTGTSR